MERSLDGAPGIGGSDVAAILGLHPYKSPVDVYLEKTGAAGDDEDNEPAHWGRRLEGVIAEEWAARSGYRVRRVNRTLRHREAQLLMAHIDRKVEREPALLECKTASTWLADSWGPSGTDQVPEYYLTQVLHYLEVTGYQWAAVGVLLGGQEFRRYEIPADRGLQQRIVDECLRWWRQHVEAGEPPPPRDPREASKLWPRHRPEAEVSADEDTQRVVAELRDVQAQRKELERRESQLKADVQARMGDAEKLIGLDGRPLATWKAPAPSRQVDVKALREAEPEVAERYMVERPGARKFQLEKGANDVG
mgnify:CR=1 FL=1